MGHVQLGGGRVREILFLTESFFLLKIKQIIQFKSKEIVAEGDERCRTYSHSQLSTYETCPHQYKLAYIDKIEVETEGIEAFMGSRVHDALEKLYRDLKVTKLNSLEELLNFYHQSWEKNWNDMIQIIRKEYSAEDYRRLGERCITDYYKRYYPFDQGKTLGLEEYISFPLEEEKDYWIRGYIDRVTLVDSSILEIHDYKTSNRLPTQEDVNSDRQLAFYQMGVAEKWQGVQEVRLIWHYLTFDTEIHSSRIPDELHQLRQATLELIRRIETDRHFSLKKGLFAIGAIIRDSVPKENISSQWEAFRLMSI